jgi:ATP-dependent helicase HrpB
MVKTPSIASQRVPLTLEILAPNHRPVQVTNDLPSFWSEHYPKLKPALQRRYPKHEWR